MQIYQLSQNIKSITLLHISFNGNLEGTWNPKIPDGDDSIPSQYPEPSIPRISCAPTILQCFQAIYPNISKYFEIDNYPYMEFYVYTPILTGNERIFTPKELTNRNLVHDAHVTNEYCILDPVYMQLINHIKIFNTNKNEIQYYQPFNNKSKSKIVFAPKTIKWEYIK